jgi:glycerophosphoryl diester phosphodiesterase
MESYNRRTFLKHSAMLTATAAASRLFLSEGQEYVRATTREPATSLPFMNQTQIPLVPSTGIPNAADRKGADHPFFTQAKNHPEVIAHRGGNGQWPGETLYAYEQAMKIGVDILEMDIHTTSDGEIVLMHNSTVNETTNGTGPINNFTLAKLRELNAGYRWSADGGNSFPYRDLALTVPTLKEVFAAFPQMRMNIEIKQSQPSMIAPFCKMLREHKMTDKVLVASFWDGVLKEFRRQCPEVATSASTKELLTFIARNNSLTGGSYKPEADAIQVKEKVVNYPVVTKKFVDRVHARFNKLPVHAWTVNDLNGMNSMIASGVDGIITDYPGPLLALLGRTPRPA